MDKERPIIVVAERLDDEAVDRLRGAGSVEILPSCDRDALMSAVGDCDALVVRTYAQVTAEILEKGTRLRVVGRAGTGLDNVDVETARMRGVRVVYTPAAATDTVAEHTVGLMLALERHVIQGDAMIRRARFLEARRTLLSRELRGLTLGVVGMGRIGRAVGRICHDGIGMQVLYNDIRDIGALNFEATRVEKDQLYRESDVVTLHVPLDDSTRGLINTEALSQFKRSATLVNTSRGPVVDAAALAVVLNEGDVSGAAIDVHDPEPPPEDYPLFSARNCLLSPHVASRTTAGLSRMNDVVDDVLAVLAGNEPRFAAC